MTDIAGGALLELFREEVRGNARILNEGLVALERNPDDLRQIEPLMRAAHSVKGAARVVNVDAAVTLAHAAEDCLVAAQQGRIRLASSDIDLLLEATDLLAGISEAAGPHLTPWLVEAAASLQRVAAALQARARGEETPQAPAPSASQANAESAPASTEPTPATATRPDAPTDAASADDPSAAAPAAAQPVVAAHRPTTAAEPSSDAPAGAAPAAAAEQVVRVTAGSLSRLMGLAGEALVEARWLQPFASSLLHLKREQARLADLVQELRQFPPERRQEPRFSELADAAGERVGACRRLLEAQMEQFQHRARNADELNSRLYQEVIASRMRPFADGVQGLARMVRDLARQLGKEVEFRIEGEQTAVDRDILEEIQAPLNHLLRNALDHGLEPPEERRAAGKAPQGRLTVEARHHAGMLAVTVRDDGRGIDLERIRAKVVARRLADERLARDLSSAELLEFLFLPAFSTAEGVTELSGRGVGLDVVHSMAQAVGGSVRIDSRLGRGTSFRLELPITLSVVRAVIVRIGGEPYAFPHHRVDRLLRLSRGELHAAEHRHFADVDGRHVGLVRADRVFELADASAEREELLAILFSHHGDQYGLVVDELCGERDLVVKPLDPRLGKVPNIQAAAILDDGSPALIVDLDDLRRSIEQKLQDASLTRIQPQTAEAEVKPPKRVLVVDDSITVREVQRQLLTQRGYEVAVAVDGIDGWHALARGQFDLVITDIDMPRLNGLDLVRKIKADARLRALPVIIVSYKDQEEYRLRGMEAGADYYLAKSSFHDDALTGAVEDLIGAAHS